MSSSSNGINASYHWYAVYTKPRNEKKAFDRLTKDGFEVYLPLISRIKQWSDRKKKVEEPLFKSYLFVKVSNIEYYNILKDPATVRYICFEGKAAPIRNEDITNIKKFLLTDYEIETTSENIEPGTNIVITAGPMMGMKGELVEKARKKRVVIRLDIIGQNLLVHVPLQMVKKA